MHLVGKVERRRVRAQFDDVALGADRVDAILEEVIANLVEQVRAVFGGFE